jgi:hypothetical protein
MAHMLREAQTLVGSGDPSGRSAAPHMLATPQSQARWVQQVLAHVSVLLAVHGVIPGAQSVGDGSGSLGMGADG